MVSTPLKNISQVVLSSQTFKQLKLCQPKMLYNISIICGFCHQDTKFHPHCSGPEFRAPFPSQRPPFRFPSASPAGPPLRANKDCSFNMELATKEGYQAGRDPHMPHGNWLMLYFDTNPTWPPPDQSHLPFFPQTNSAELQISCRAALVPG